ncbi:MAG: hypothetical protein J6Y41_00395 [Bacteroidaceae bacterium]|nr:hypothetical protein [Bacteroidaceae bacterium]
MRYIIKRRCLDNILQFYVNVSKKYKHTYSKELMQANVTEAYDAMFLIENKLLRRIPTLNRWKNEGWYMASSGKWMYAYTVEDDVVTIQDACHKQNMHD